ncbi:Male-specific lethal 3 [Halocaridina rubra]|uniref:Male-specific lethal 3 n=1 Tax=Halocaridina rubra TaxID=373956 RepID=A0AAN9A698_HALRR
MDGIRIVFDFHIETHLLYKKELKQAEKLRSAKPIFVKGEIDLTPELMQVDLKEIDESGSCKEDMDNEEPKVKPDKPSKEEEKAKPEGIGRRQLRSKRLLSSDACPLVEREKLPPTQTCESGRSTPTTITSGASTAGVSGLGSGGMDCTTLYQNVQPLLRDWTLLPEAFRDPPPPSLLYGPLHLLRLFVKFPEILYRMNLPELKRKIILKHVELFLEYVSSHSEELFPESGYVPSLSI